ncbi:fungal-specific transcription factor domain-containing protein [Hypoxylon sp. FL0543]|nr:fungal-specific transcription factor domain-containing protein [Hypoxylon sp. FL0543]
MDLLRPNSAIRSFNGCWTCRLRRKKCDEKHPVCGVCSALRITCHFGQEKPDWMDGGVRQEEMAERLKREVREKAQQRREGRDARISSGHTSGTEPTADLHTDGIDGIEPSRGDFGCTLTSNHPTNFGRSDSIFLIFYLEHVFPFLFPFYRPSIYQGGKAWVLEMMMSRPVVRQAALCQSSYFFSLVRGTANHDVVWETVLAQTRHAFGVLRQALQVVSGSDITQHLHGAVRILASIMQVQRFEIAVLSFNNFQAHLSAASALFRQLLDGPGAVDPGEPISRFNSLVSLLEPPPPVFPADVVQIPSAEQAAFRFSSALLIFDDIIASTVLQEQPRLYDYYTSLLTDTNGADPPINLEAVVGCQNWALVQISEIAALDTWKQRCKRAGNLDVMELVHSAAIIKDSLESNLTRLETNPITTSNDDNGCLDALITGQCQRSKSLSSQSSLATRIWAHAALLYLFIVVSGWQPANFEVRYHVGQIIDLLTHQISPPALLRTMVWPFCVAGCLAEPAQEARFREMVNGLQPASVFGIVRKALEIMENVWGTRDARDATNRDLAACFKIQGDIVLLI